MICCYIILPSFNLTDSMHKVNSTKTWIFLVGRLSASSFLQNKEEGHNLSSKYPLTNALVIEWEQISAASHHDLVENYPRRTAALIGTNQRVWFWKVEFKMWNMYMTSNYKGQIWVKCNNNTKNRWQKKSLFYLETTMYLQHFFLMMFPRRISALWRKEMVWG